jgi:hypothetical protein
MNVYFIMFLCNDVSYLFGVVVGSETFDASRGILL